MSKRLAVGDKVRFAAPNGSTGEVTYVREDGPFAGNPRYYVRWHYGLDVYGERMTALSGLMHRHELEVVSEEEFLRVADGPAFGGAK